MRKLNEMFHVDDEGYLVKTSNGERVPEDEPLFILRGRDVLAAATIQEYGRLMIEMKDADPISNPMRIFAIGEVFGSFLKFRHEHPDRMKQPGCTQGR